MSAIFSGGGGVETELDPVFSATGITAPLIANWNTAFGWGNHASAGYLLSATAANTYQPIDGDLTAIGGLSGTSGLLRKTAANTWALDTNTYLTSFTETDPVFTASPAAGVTSQKITNWDTAFGWGNHASAGYQSALGFTPLNRAGDSISATNGSGFIGYPSQSGTPSTPSSGFRFYANASHALSWVGQNGFTRTFDGTANTANCTYTLPNSSGTIALEGTLTSLANPTIQNGVYQFVQNTKPTQRATGVPLVAGDRWFKTDDGTEWFWNGTYWLGLSPIIRSGYGTRGDNGGFSTTNSIIMSPRRGSAYMLFLESADYMVKVTTADPLNYWDIKWQNTVFDGNAFVGSTFPGNPGFTVNSPTDTGNKQVINVFRSSSLPVVAVGAVAYKTGSPSNISMSYNMILREVFP